MSKESLNVWQTNALTKKYLEGVRGAIPLAQEQMQVMLRLIRSAQPDLKSVLDFGCGDGILGQAVLDQHPLAHGVFLDFSGPMLEAAWERLADYRMVSFILADYGETGWQQHLQQVAGDVPSGNGRDEPSADNAAAIRFDAIISGYSIHHQPDERKRELYAELFDLLSPGGIFINVEHVSSPSDWVESVFNDHFVDSLVDYHQRHGSPKSRQEIDREYYSRPDKEANILAPMEVQCDWLRAIGFQDVDCYLKIFELAVFGGIKPAVSQIRSQ
jgi:tRNA (cmo5U34)-methyltransferase